MVTLIIPKWLVVIVAIVIVANGLEAITGIALHGLQWIGE
jgi:presenilin-like A22 family membrane protease